MGLALLGAVSQGILWGIMVLGVFITYKLLDIADRCSSWAGWIR